MITPIDTANANRHRYTVAVTDGWITDSEGRYLRDAIRHDCGHLHRTEAAAHACKAHLQRRYGDGSTSAKWYNCDILRVDALGRHVPYTEAESQGGQIHCEACGKIVPDAIRISLCTECDARYTAGTMENTQQSVQERLENESLNRAYHAIMANPSYRKAVEAMDGDKVYVQTCSAHGTPLLLGPFESFAEAHECDATYRDRGVFNPPPREVLIGWETNPAQHGVTIRKYLAGEL